MTVEEYQQADKVVKFINNHKFIIGVVGTSKNNKRKKSDQTNVELLIDLSNGSKIKNIPARPVLTYAVDDITKEGGLLSQFYDEVVDGIYRLLWKEVEAERCANKWAIRFQNYTRDLIYNSDSRIARNSKLTIERKGSDKPLFDTGQLARSIVCMFVLKSEYKT